MYGFQKGLSGKVKFSMLSFRPKGETLMESWRKCSAKPSDLWRVKQVFNFILKKLFWENIVNGRYLCYHLYMYWLHTQRCYQIIWRNFFSLYDKNPCWYILRIKIPTTFRTVWQINYTQFISTQHLGVKCIFAWPKFNCIYQSLS